MKFEDIGLKQNRFEQRIQILLCFRRDRDHFHIAAPIDRLNAESGEALLDLIGIRVRLVDLVDRDDDRNAGRLRVLNGFDRLRHHAVVRRDNENYNIRRLGTASTHHCERFVARCIEKYDSALFVAIFGIRNKNAVSTDMLRNTACFTFRHIGRTDRVEQ